MKMPSRIEQLRVRSAPLEINSGDFRAIGHGLVDRIIARHDLRDAIVKFLHYLMPALPPAPEAAEATEATEKTQTGPESEAAVPAAAEAVAA